MMAFILLVICIYLLHVLLKQNPFDRVVFNREYSIHYSTEFIDTLGYCCVAEIRFLPKARSVTLRTAIFDCTFSHPKAVCIRLVNMPPHNHYFGSINMFNFACIDFSALDYIAGNYQHKAFPFVSDEFPCTRLILPSNIQQIEIVNHCPNLQSLVIPSKEFVPVLWGGVPYDDPILVQPGFHIEVSSELIDAYRSDEQWSHVTCCDATGHIFKPAFTPIRR